MAYTTQNRDDVKAAIVALATGARVATVTFADRTVSYQQAELDELRQVLTQIEAELDQAAATPRPRVYGLYGSKGL